MLDCRQVLAEISNYLDDEVTHELARAIEKHLARCHRCWVVYDTTRKTLEIVSDCLPTAAPIEVSERLHALVRQLFVADQ